MGGERGESSTRGGEKCKIMHLPSRHSFFMLAVHASCIHVSYSRTSYSDISYLMLILCTLIFIFHALILLNLMLLRVSILFYYYFCRLG